MSPNEFAELSASLLTPLIALIAVYIAWQQWQTNKKKLGLDRYDRRLVIYEEVIRYLSIILRDADVDLPELLKFRTSTSEADFLFGGEIGLYIDELYKRGNKLRYWNHIYRDDTQPYPEGYDHQKVVEGMHSELTWLTEQFTPAKEKFRKYLDVSG